jgi:hypothetical protein
VLHGLASKVFRQRRLLAKNASRPLSANPLSDDIFAMQLAQHWRNVCVGAAQAKLRAAFFLKVFDEYSF